MCMLFVCMHGTRTVPISTFMAYRSSLNPQKLPFSASAIWSGRTPTCPTITCCYPNSYVCASLISNYLITVWVCKRPDLWDSGLYIGSRSLSVALLVEHQAYLLRRQWSINLRPHTNCATYFFLTYVYIHTTHRLTTAPQMRRLHCFNPEWLLAFPGPLMPMPASPNPTHLNAGFNRFIPTRVA